MKILNPDYLPATDANAPEVKHRAAVLAVFKAATDKEALSFNEVRAAMGKTDKQLPDGAIHRICLDAGMTVVRE